MAESFADMEAAEKIRTAATLPAAEDAVKNIKNYDENSWNAVKMSYWEEAQRLKLEQVRWIQNLLVFSDATFIAVASQDKVFGTGWRKNRQEAGWSRMWDGENGGGKALMKLREEFKKQHSWMGPNEQQETEKKYKELKQSAWRRQNDRERQQGGGRGGGGFRGRGSPRGMGMRGSRGGSRGARF